MTGRPIGRRRALQLGALGAAGVAGIAVGGVGLSRTGLPFAALPGAGGEGGVPVTEPAVLRSQAGLLQVELTLARTRLEVAGRTVTMLTYNGTVPGPTWRIRPGDRIEVQVVNTLDAPTNLHFHGLQVSPQGAGDNPFVSIEPGQRFDYCLDVPPDHPAGVFWYHPHRHGVVADQLFGGLYGTIVVDGDDPGDTIAVARDRVLVLSDVSFASDGTVTRASAAQRMTGREGELVLVNGGSRPRLAARPGERERWRLVNACTSRYLQLALDGQQLRLLGVDGGHEAGAPVVEQVLLAPGNRADVLVDLQAGTGQLRTVGYDRGGAMMGMMGGGAALSGPVTLATVTVDGAAIEDAGPVPSRAADPDLRGRPIAATREISFTMGMGAMMGGGMGGPGSGAAMMDFGFDDRPFDAGRTDQAPAAGTIEQWTIRNPTPMDHPFHLHIWPMQMIEEHGRAVEPPRWRDVVNVPARGQVRVLVDFTRFPGRSVYHCHILDHEDAGMMATVDVR